TFGAGAGPLINSFFGAGCCPNNINGNYDGTCGQPCDNVSLFCGINCPYCVQDNFEGNFTCSAVPQVTAGSCFTGSIGQGGGCPSTEVCPYNTICQNSTSQCLFNYGS